MGLEPMLRVTGVVTNEALEPVGQASVRILLITDAAGEEVTVGRCSGRVRYELQSNSNDVGAFEHVARLFRGRFDGCMAVVIRGPDGLGLSPDTLTREITIPAGDSLVVHVTTVLGSGPANELGRTEADPLRALRLPGRGGGPSSAWATVRRTAMGGTPYNSSR